MSFDEIRAAIGESDLQEIITQAALGCFLPTTGNSGSYSIARTRTEGTHQKMTFLAIAKPSAEEPLAHDNPFRSQRLKRWFAQRFHFTALQTQAGQGVYGEAAAYTTALWVKKHLKSKDSTVQDTSSIVPKTYVIENFKFLKNKQIISRTVSLQLSATQENPSCDYIDAHQLFHVTHHYDQKRIPPRFEKIKNFFRRLFHIPIPNSPWETEGKWIKFDTFKKAQQLLNTALSEQFYLMSVHNYLINDVDKHSENWLIVGDYKQFIQLIQANKTKEAGELAKTFKISSIDNGASFAPTQQKRWDFFQTRNRMQFYKLPIAQKTLLNKEHIEHLWTHKKEFAQAIFDQYYNTEKYSITEQRVYSALMRLSALHEFVSDDKQRSVSELCQQVKYHDQIDHYGYQSATHSLKLYNLIDTIRFEKINPDYKKDQKKLKKIKKKEDALWDERTTNLQNAWNTAIQKAKSLGSNANPNTNTPFQTPLAFMEDRPFQAPSPTPSTVSQDSTPSYYSANLE